MLEWQFWLSYQGSYRRVWVSCLSLWDKMLFLIFWKRIFLGMRKLVPWWKKFIVDLTSLVHLHKWFKVSWNQCQHLCSWRWLGPRRNLAKSLIPRRLWILKILLAQGRMKFRSFILKISSLAQFLILKSSLAPSDIAKRKDEFLLGRCYG